MRARILHAVTAAAAGAARPQCAAPLLRPAALLHLPHPASRRHQSSNSRPPKGDGGSSPAAPQSPSDQPSTLADLLADLVGTNAPSTSDNSNSYSPSPSQASQTRHSSTSFLDNLNLSRDPSQPALYTNSFLPSADDRMRVPRMGPSAGRSVLVQGDVTVAFTRLKGLVTANRVRSDMNKQRFHERPGMKRKRLKRERHRRRFKEGFKRMVGVVLDMKNRGM